MKNSLSEELAHVELKRNDLNVIGIIKNVYQTLLIAKERLTDVLYNNSEQWGKGKLKRTFDVRNTNGILN